MATLTTLIVSSLLTSLQLNIWANTKCLTHKCSVYFWIPGGGFIYGTGSYYNGTRLAARGDIVVVSTSYRLGIFGFLQHEQIKAETANKTLGGMNGLLDSLLALKWTHANIAGFGGDSHKITVGGESAGAVATCMHAHSTLSRGLYNQLVMESGDCTGSSCGEYAHDTHAHKCT